MFFQFVSTLAFYFNSLYRYIYEGEVTIKFVTINMGGKTHNPFEYVYDTPNHTSFDNYKINLSVLTKSKLMNFLNQEKNQIKFPYFKTFLENINEEIIFNYFFTNETDSKYYLKFDSKIGRNTGYRFNPIEHGYDKISKYIGKYWNEITETNYNFPENNQYYFVRNYAKNNYNIQDLIHICLYTMYEKNTYEKTDQFHRLVLFDLMNIFAVYYNYEDFDKIYMDNEDDTRIEQIVKDGTPMIIVTQEKGLCEFDKLKVIKCSDIKNGTNMYRYNIDDNDIDILSIQDISDINNEYIGNKKGFIINLKLYGKNITINSLHCKEYSKVHPQGTVEDLIDNGIINLLNSKSEINMILGDFNPENNYFSSDFKDMIRTKTNSFIYPANNINTTKKVRSGYCAQMSKFFKTNDSEVSKDMIIYNGPNEYIYDTQVYPSLDNLLSKTWPGDHSSVSLSLSFKIIKN